jgi:hypothetical protein
MKFVPGVRPSRANCSFRSGTNYDIARDGRILINTVLDETAAPITLLMNWTPAAKK